MRYKYMVRDVDGLSDWVVGIRYDEDTKEVLVGGPMKWVAKIKEVLKTWADSEEDAEWNSSGRTWKMLGKVIVVKRVFLRGIETLRKRYSVDEVKRFRRLMR